MGFGFKVFTILLMGLQGALLVSCTNVSEQPTDSADSNDTASDSTADTATDTTTETVVDTGTSLDSDTNPCNDFEDWYRFCAAATTEEECAVASEGVFKMWECCDDCWNGCGWLPAVSTVVNDSGGCEYGETVFSCMYFGGGEGYYDNSPPCDGQNEARGFLLPGPDSATLLGFAYGAAFAPEEAGGALCDPLSDTDSICPCLCAPDFPIQAIP